MKRCNSSSRSKICSEDGTPDSKMEQNFALHETAFDALLAKVSADDKFEMLNSDFIRYSGHTFSRDEQVSDLGHVGLTREGWAWYRQQLRELGLVQITKGGGGVEFRVDSGSLLNGDSYKGYEYSVTPPVGQRKTNLDTYQISGDDSDRSSGGYCVYKPIKGNWYLYLFVKGS